MCGAGGPGPVLERRTVPLPAGSGSQRAPFSDPATGELTARRNLPCREALGRCRTLTSTRRSGRGLCTGPSLLRMVPRTQTGHGQPGCGARQTGSQRRHGLRRSVPGPATPRLWRFPLGGQTMPSGCGSLSPAPELCWGSHRSPPPRAGSWARHPSLNRPCGWSRAWAPAPASGGAWGAAAVRWVEPCPMARTPDPTALTRSQALCPMSLAWPAGAAQPGRPAFPFCV